MKNQLEELYKLDRMSKNELLSILRKHVLNIYIADIMKADLFLRSEDKYVPPKYREELLKTSTKAFFSRIKNIKEDKKSYKGYVKTKDIKNLLDVLEKQEKEASNENEISFIRISKIILIYTVFIVNEAIHPVGTPFPGGFKVRYKNGKYLCPVKEIQKKNPNALCRFCVSVQDNSEKL
jgi:uncharacterized protein (UPF0305 family)